MKKLKGFTVEEYNSLKENCFIERKCKQCENSKLLTSFQRKLEKNNLIYFNYVCNKCAYDKRKEKYKEKTQSYLKSQKNKEFFTIEGRASMLIHRVKNRAKNYNMEFSLTKENIIKSLEKGKCCKTNIPFVLNDKPYNPYSPSIDRIDNNKGYIDGNVQIVCMIYNFCKNQFAEEDVEHFIKNAKLWN